MRKARNLVTAIAATAGALSISTALFGMGMVSDTMTPTAQAYPGQWCDGGRYDDGRRDWCQAGNFYGHQYNYGVHDRNWCGHDCGRGHTVDIVFTRAHPAPAGWYPGCGWAEPPNGWVAYEGWWLEFNAPAPDWRPKRLAHDQFAFVPPWH